MPAGCPATVTAPPAPVAATSRAAKDGLPTLADAPAIRARLHAAMAALDG